MIGAIRQEVCLIRKQQWLGKGILDEEAQG